MEFVEFFGIVKRCYFEARKNKRYGGDQIEFEVDLAASLLHFATELWNRIFRILQNYAFLTSIPRWREIFATFCEGRIADHMLCDPLKPFMELELSDRTYNNREGKGSMAAVNQVIEDMCTVTKGYTKPARIIKLDLKGYFPSAQWSYMEECINGVISKYEKEIDELYGDGYAEFLKWLAMICINCNPAAHCELRTPKSFWYEQIPPEKSMFSRGEGVGAPIGRLASQHAMGLYINDIIIWLNEDCGIYAVCFVDDITMVVPEEHHQYALSLIPVIRQKLASRGLRLNEKKFYDQPYQHGLELLGSHIKPYRIHLNNRTYNRGLEKLAEYNVMDSKEKVFRLTNFIASVNSYTGQLKNGTDHKRTVFFRNCIASEWWNYADWDDRRLCVVPKKGYKRRDILSRRYGSSKRKRKHLVQTH